MYEHTVIAYIVHTHTQTDHRYIPLYLCKRKKLKATEKLSANHT